MENNSHLQSPLFSQTNEKVAEQTLVQSFFAKTYAWMFISLILTAATAYLVASSPQLTRAILGNSFLFFGLLIAEVGLVGLLTATINRMATPVAFISLFAYAILNGLTLSIIFFIYSISTIGIAFIATAVIYGVMAIYGFITKSDLSPIANFLFIALLGGIIVSIINVFLLHSSTLELVISIALVLVFAGLTAYDHQKLKNFALQSQALSQSEITKASIFGALQLYLDFINIFLLLLRIFTDRN